MRYIYVLIFNVSFWDKLLYTSVNSLTITPPYISQVAYKNIVGVIIMDKPIPKSESSTPLPGYVSLIREEENDHDNKNPQFIIKLENIEKPENGEKGNKKEHEIRGALQEITYTLFPFSDNNGNIFDHSLELAPEYEIVTVTNFGNGNEWRTTKKALEEYITDVRGTML